MWTDPIQYVEVPVHVVDRKNPALRHHLPTIPRQQLVLIQQWNQGHASFPIIVQPPIFDPAVTQELTLSTARNENIT
jgi:hypothetical protein